MQTVKLKDCEFETLVEVIARRCYADCDFQILNGEEVSLFRFDLIHTIVDESFFEILPRFAENEDEIYIEEMQMEEVCEKIKKILNSDYEVFDKDNFEEALDDYEYDLDNYYWID